MMKSTKKDACVQFGVDESLVTDNEFGEIEIEWKFTQPGLFNDVKLIVEDKTFYSHRIILANCSPVFTIMLSSDFLEKSSDKIIIKDIKPESMEVTLQAIYSSNYKCTKEKEALLMLPVVDCYQISHLQNEIENKLIEILTNRNDKCREYMKLGHCYNLKRLKQICFDILTRPSNKSFLKDLKNDPELKEFETELLRARIEAIESVLHNIELCFNHPCTRVEKKEVRVPANYCSEHTMPFSPSSTSPNDICGECVKRLKAHIKSVCNIDRIRTTVTNPTASVSINANNNVATTRSTSIVTSISSSDSSRNYSNALSNVRQNIVSNSENNRENQSSEEATSHIQASSSSSLSTPTPSESTSSTTRTTAEAQRSRNNSPSTIVSTNIISEMSEASSVASNCSD